MENWRLSQDLLDHECYIESEIQIATTHAPVSERALKKEDFPTFGRPEGGGCWFTKRVECKEQTYDADLKVVAGSAEESFLLGSNGLFGGHFLLDGEGWRC